MDGTTAGPGAGPRIPDATDSGTCAMARFEFEAGRGNEGTKVLMVEWDPAAAPEPIPARDGRWEVTWEGQTADSFSQIDGAAAREANDSATIQRAYILIFSTFSVPSALAIRHPTGGPSMTTKCMPAIFDRKLGLDGGVAGRRGVLHTIWAKKRLAQLQEELRVEQLENTEGVALHMVCGEIDFVCEHFGLEKPAPVRPKTKQPPPPLQPSQAAVPPALQSPRTPMGGRLSEKLKGLKLTTSSTESFPGATPISGPTGATKQYQALSPLATMNAPKFPPAATGMASLDAVMGDDKGQNSKGADNAPTGVDSQSKETEDELFALPMSPRSPEMTKSPFSLLK